MKIQLIHPPAVVNLYALTALRPSLPLGLAYIAATLRDAGHGVSVVDALGLAPDQVRPGVRRGLSQIGLTPDEIVARISADTDAIGITNMWSFCWPVVRDIVRKLKARFPEKPIIAGGEHFTALPEYSMRQAPLDFIVLGEGEEGAVELLRELERGREDWSEVPGIWFRGENGPTKSSRPRPRRKDLDSIPWPAWDLFDVGAYNKRRLVTGICSGMTIPILATRGCPYQCAYCSSPNMWTTRWYHRDPVDVVDEMEHWHTVLGANNFPFHDLTAIIKKNWILGFCKELARRDMCGRINWQLPTGTRLEVIDDEVACWLARVNGRTLSYAPESGSTATRQRIKKQMKEESLIAAVKAATKYRLNLSAFFVAGFPGDTAADLKATVRLARRLARRGTRDLAVGYFFPLPNTQLFSELQQTREIVLNDDFLLTPIYANELRLRDENNYSHHLSSRRLTWYRYWILLNFYAISFSLRPWRFVATLWRALCRRETTKLESYLVDLPHKLAFVISTQLAARWFTRTRKAHQPQAAEGAWPVRQAAGRARGRRASERPVSPTVLSS
ncbi:MAG: radical SAM protein [Planctomycetota bacterium]